MQEGDLMNEKTKSFFIGIGTGLLTVLAFILGGLFHNRRTTDTVGANLSGAERTARETERTTTDAIKTNTELAGTVERGKSVLQEIRKQKVN